MRACALAGHELVLGRQLVKTPYINPQDNRMLPNTVEGAVITRRRDEAQTFDYGVGYLWGFKARDSSATSCRSPTSSASTQDRGVLAGGVKVVPIEGLTLGAIDYLDRRRAQHDVCGSRLDHPRRADAVSHQRQLHRPADRRRRSHRRRALRDDRKSRRALPRATAMRRCLSPARTNGDGAALQGPFGSFPAYTVLDQLNFNEAGEKTRRGRRRLRPVARCVIDGLKVQTRYGWAWDAVDAPSGTPLTRQNEFNVELEYLPTSGPFENIHVQVFYSVVELPGNPPGETQQPQVRGIVTYLVPLL